ncbi:hypothetical protein V9T40_008123 [Parthenolecanium corni]|uniref:Reticulocalbin-3 n=1 Tax=Parthenolecanium corni TaxID=536013 RepID=A0AAN9U016_9HEMI
MFLCFVVFILVHNLTFAIPKQEETNHKIANDLGNKEHYQNEEHNKEYDHEAFLGEEAKTFDQLTPEESQKRLSIIIDKIDRDGDGYITFDELKTWIIYTQKKYLTNDVNKQWQTRNVEGNDKITWDAYRKAVYGFSHDYEASQLDKEEEVGGYSFKSVLDRDKRRWNVADIDGDGALTRDEFAAFLHPNENERMKDIVVLEAIEDIDKDKDGKISLEEYIGDMFPDLLEPGEELPEWVKNEKEQFSKYRDKNHDGVLDNDEVRDWILPEGFDHADAEARHLIYESDSDADEKLTKEEILNKYDLFVGSQATDFGEALARHDEF